MDFSFHEDQESLRELATRIFTDLATQERLRAMETGAEGDGERFDAKLWAELATAGLLGIGLPESVGGAGLGFLEIGILAELAGRTAAYVPVIETLAVSAAAVASFGTGDQQQSWLPGVVAGTSILTSALAEPGGTPLSPATTATRSADGWVLNGVKSFVPSGMIADAVLVPARVDEENVSVFIVPTAGPGVARERQVVNTGQSEARFTFSSAELDAAAQLGSTEQGPAIVESMIQRNLVAVSLAQAGACAASVELVGEYTKGREQFGKAIATFQAVGQRAADAYVDAEAVRLTAWQAAWRLSEDLPADKEVAVAKFWAADGGQRVVHAAVHLHGGVGVDREYPLHRYFLMTKHFELTLGGATDQLRQLGATLAAEPV